MKKINLQSKIKTRKEKKRNLYIEYKLIIKNGITIMINSLPEKKRKKKGIKK